MSTLDEIFEDFRGWLRGRETDAELASTVEMILRYKLDYLNGDAYDWQPADIDELLLRLLPAKYVDETPEDGIVEAALGEYLSYVVETGRLSRRSARPEELTAALAEAAEQYPAAMNDPSRWGPAKSAFMPAVEAGVDLTDDQAVRAYIEQYNAELGAMPPPAMEPWDAPLPEQVTALVEGIGLVEHRGTEAVLELVTATPFFATEIGAAVGAGADAESVLRRWEDAVIEELCSGAVASRAVVGLLFRLFPSGPVPLDELAAFLAEAFGAEAAGLDTVDTLTRWLSALDPIGIAEVGDGSVELTELGTWVAAGVIRDEEATVAFVGPMKETSPRELLTARSVLEADEADALFERWTDAHGVAAAASYLVSFGAIYPKDNRPPYLELADRIGTGGIEGVRDLMVHGPALASVAREWLTGHGAAPDDPITPRERWWTVVDNLVTKMLTDPRTVLARLDSVLVPEELEAFLAEGWRCGHLFTRDVLDAIGQDHPRKPIRRLARKALHKVKTSEEPSPIA